MDWTHVVQTAVSGLVTGGAGAATTLLAFFRETRGRIDKVEKAVGSPGSPVEPRTGLFLLVAQLDEQMKALSDAQRKFKREIDGWEDDPPEWLTRTVNRRSMTSVNTEHFEDFEQRVEMRVKGATDRLKRLEEALTEVSERVSALPGAGNYVDADLYEQDSEKRAEEIRRIQESLHAANGFLRGVMATLGYIEPEVQKSPPPLPPRRKP